jgi:hypothetical protein
MMPVRYRKLVGMLIISIGLVIYAITAVYIAIEVLPDNWLIELLYYCIAGTIWAFPARTLLVWIYKVNATPKQ